MGEIVLLFRSSKGWLPRGEGKPGAEGGSEAGRGSVRADKGPIPLPLVEEQSRPKRCSSDESVTVRWGSGQAGKSAHGSGPNQWGTCPDTGIAATKLRRGPRAKA